MFQPIAMRDLVRFCPSNDLHVLVFAKLGFLDFATRPECLSMQRFVRQAWWPSTKITQISVMSTTFLVIQHVYALLNIVL